MSKTEINEIEVNGVAYIRKDSVKETQMAVDTDGLKYVIVRSRDAGCFAGYLWDQISADGGCEVHLKNARRLWYWDGASSLSQLSQEGVKKPENCKFPCVVPEIEVFGVCEVIPATEDARKSIEGVPVWKQ